MSITSSNLTVSNTAPAGTTIGLLTTTDASGTAIPCNYMLTKGSIGYFAIAGDNLITAWTAPATPGHYSIRLRALGSNTRFSGSATFTVEVGTAAPPPPPPSVSPVITVTPNTPQLPDTTSRGAVVATYTVAMTDGSPFVGTIGFGPPNFDAGGIFALAGSPTSGNVVVNPNGPGVGPNLSMVTDHITLVATQP